MDSFISRPEQERRDILREAASRKDVTEIIMEKDFWVCWTLKRLFSNPVIAEHLTFKGGTSLSKGYQAIERFSEDIDLTIHRSAPHLSDGDNPMAGDISGKERERRLKALEANTQKFISGFLLPELKRSFTQYLGAEDSARWSLHIDQSDNKRQTLLFDYPFLFSDGRWGRTMWEELGEYMEGKDFSYIQNTVKLEFGARGDIVPNERRTITSYVAEIFPDLFGEPECMVSILSAERTFWEKATILHALHHNAKLRDRMSRHYYDTYMLDQQGIAASALVHSELLADVVRNKSTMFKDNSASYDTAVMRTLKLLPKDEHLSSFRQDYAKMAEMFMGDHPDFNTVMDGLSDLEKRINQH